MHIIQIHNYITKPYFYTFGVYFYQSLYNMASLANNASANGNEVFSPPPNNNNNNGDNDIDAVNNIIARNTRDTTPRQERAPSQPITSDDLLIDDTLPILERVVKYSTAQMALQRSVHVRMLGETAKIAGSEASIERLVPLLTELSVDVEAVIRRDLAFQLYDISEACCVVSKDDQMISNEDINNNINININTIINVIINIHISMNLIININITLNITITKII